MTLNAHYQRVGMIKKAGLSSFYSVGPGHAVHALEFSHYREAYPLCQFAARDVLLDQILASEYSNSFGRTLVDV